MLSPCGVQAGGEEVAAAPTPAIAAMVMRMMPQLTARLVSAAPLLPTLQRPCPHRAFAMRLRGDARAYPAIGRGASVTQTFWSIGDAGTRLGLQIRRERWTVTCEQ